MIRPPGFSLPPLLSFLLIPLTNTDGADSEPYESMQVCNSEIMPTDE